MAQNAENEHWMEDLAEGENNLPEQEGSYTPKHAAPEQQEAVIQGQDFSARKQNRPVHKDGSRPSGKKKKRHRRHKSARVYGVLIMLTLIFVISISLAIGIITVGKDMLGIDGTETLVLFNIPEGATTAEIAEDLHEAGIIKIPKAFVYFSRLSNADADYIAGDHEVSSAMAYETIINELTGTAVEDDVVTVDIMFPEGIDLHEAAQLLEENDVCDAQRFLYYFNAAGLGYDFENYLPPSSSKLKFYRMEGYLFPDTYTFYEGMEPDDVCRKIYMNFNLKMKPEYYEKMEELDITLDEVITLASMVQAEAANTAEMPDIASVFWNRLKHPDEFPKLQSDPTTYYVEDVIKPNIELPDELIYEAYDTYICSGLPVGAIGNPGLDAIEAVLYPNDTEYFFFYANVDTGVTYFAKTLEEHEANKNMVAQQQAGEEGGGEDYEE